MKILGFNFNQISIERMENPIKDLKINSKIDLLNIEDAKTDLFDSKEDFFTIKFTFSVDYEPDIAKIIFKGNILFSVDKETAKTLKNQGKDKKIPEKLRIAFINLIFKKSNIRALQLEDEMNLPPHFPLPTLQTQALKDENLDKE